jgi:hypothetical protein
VRGLMFTDVCMILNSLRLRRCSRLISVLYIRYNNIILNQSQCESFESEAYVM